MERLGQDAYLLLGAIRKGESLSGIIIGAGEFRRKRPLGDEKWESRA